jgi:hypothetical protein
VSLPVDPERLRRQFPALTDDDLAAYVEVTRRILSVAGAGDRAKLTRDVLARGRGAREQPQARAPEDLLALRYLQAVEKMQGRTSS